MSTPTTRKKRAPAQGPFLVYALYDSKNKHQRTYTGQTNNFERRIRQHQGAISGGARYTKQKQDTRSLWSPLFHVKGFQTLRAVLQFELAMKKRKVPIGFSVGGPIGNAEKAKPKKAYTRGPSGRIRQLEYILSLGSLNEEAHSPFVSNGIWVECFITREMYLKMGGMTGEAFERARDLQQGINFIFLS